MNSLKVDLYPDEVYTFTPKGDVFAFPRGATPLDFAYRIHTDVGHRCVGARVNGKLVQLRTQLKNGDIVEILTGPTQTPNREWLNIVGTSRARHKIRHWLNTEQKSRSIELGRKLIDKEAKRYKVHFKKLIAENALDGVLSEYGLARLDDLYADVGYGKISAKSVVERFISPEAKEKRDQETPGLIQQAVRKIFPFTGSAAAIKVRGHDDLMTYLARCCSPVPGEQIIGYVTRGKGIAVHSASCPNVKNLMFNPDREIKVEWDTGGGSAYEIDLEVVVEDRTGMLAKVVSTIANLKTNIRNFEARTENGRGTLALSVEVQDLRQLERVIRAVSDLDGVLTVQRRYMSRQQQAAD
jgi:GTP pyrophosphokinase